MRRKSSTVTSWPRPCGRLRPVSGAPPRAGGARPAALTLSPKEPELTATDASTDLFFSLTPERVLTAVEAAGLATNPVCYPLNSFENRVYEVELSDRSRIIAKFYRPGRWSEEASHRRVLGVLRRPPQLVQKTWTAQNPPNGVGELGFAIYAAFVRLVLLWFD